MPPRSEEFQTRYSYADYLTWPEAERWEIIDGVAYNMTPAPSPRHQEILGELFRQFANWLSGKECKVYMAPFDVRLAEPNMPDRLIDQVVQPDLAVICDPAKVDDRGCMGSPDLVVEVISPATAKKDLSIKLGLYERAGVKEYWVVNPHDKTVMIFKLKQNQYGKPVVYSTPDQISVELFDGLTILLEPVFA